jgi:phosphoenolpyruvate-protein kinase (PTS system EI component)
MAMDHLSERIVGVVLAEGRAEGPVWALPLAHPSSGPTQRSLGEARQVASASLAQVATRDPGHADIVEAQRMMLEDPVLYERVEQLAADRPPDQAIQDAAEEMARQMEALDDEYLRARAMDVREVAGLWIRQLGAAEAALSGPPEPSVVVAEVIDVAWLLSQPSGQVVGVVVHHGAPTMHAAIVAGNLGIPMMLVADDDDFTQCRSAARLGVDAVEGVVWVNPGDTGWTQEAVQMDRRPIFLEDEAVAVLANAGSVLEASRAVELGAEGIGLFRTELAFEAAGRPLSVPEQEDLYEQVARLFPDGPVTFRTLDIGADKPLPGVEMPPEGNPQLGVRGVRLYRREPKLFRDQMRALLRVASRHPHVEIMFPMVGSVADWHYCRAVAEDVAQELGMSRDSWPKLGVMLEVPSAGVMVGELVQAGVQFFSIGTNDLTQYLYAQDRENPALPVPTVPVALFRFLAWALQPAVAAGVPVAVCGELGSQPLVMPLLALAGVRLFSGGAGKLEKMRRALRRLERPNWRDTLATVLNAPEETEAENRLRALAWWLE